MNEYHYKHDLDYNYNNNNSTHTRFKLIQHTINVDYNSIDANATDRPLFV